jgi:hypothetical protein
MTVVNTGNLQLKGVRVSAPERLSSVGDCDTPNDNGTHTLLAGAQMSCRARVNVTTADIEAGNTTYRVEVVATSVLGVNISSAREIFITPMQRPELLVTVLVCDAIPTMPGIACIRCKTTFTHLSLHCEQSDLENTWS